MYDVMAQDMPSPWIGKFTRALTSQVSVRFERRLNILGLRIFRSPELHCIAGLPCQFVMALVNLKPIKNTCRKKNENRRWTLVDAAFACYSFTAPQSKDQSRLVISNNRKPLPSADLWDSRRIRWFSILKVHIRFPASNLEPFGPFCFG